MFSAPRMIDFSQFKPRGHYTKSEQLKNYFRAMMWLGTVDLRIAGGEIEDNDLHQLLCAVILVHCLQKSDTMDSITKVDSLISSLVADSELGADSLSVNELACFLSADVTKLILETPSAKATDDEVLHNLLLDLQQQVVQKSRSTNLSTGKTTRTSFALFGQRFVWSAFIFSRLVYNQVVHDGKKKARRIPSAVDVAFTLFGNNEAAQVLRDRMETQGPADENAASDAPEFVPHRDGIPFASNLVALRQMIDDEFDDRDERKDSSIATSISMLWIRALRALSQSSPNTADTFHSPTWQRRQMNTQIASFTQLRHDTVVYAKQSSTIRLMCECPDGMVDPYPLFWERMSQMALRMESISDEAQRLKSINGRGLSRGEAIFDNFASTMEELKTIAVCQATKSPLSEEQTIFMKSVMDKRAGSGAPSYLGWYPTLFYACPEDSCKCDELVTDVHTNFPSVPHDDPGCVLHLGVGNSAMGFFIVNDVMYAGPVFSSYEFVTPIDQRLTDDEFKAKLPWMRAPQWAEQSYLSSAFDDASDDEEN